MITLLLLLGCGPKDFSADDEVSLEVPRGGSCDWTAFRNEFDEPMSSEIEDIMFYPGESYFFAHCSDRKGQLVYRAVMVTGVPVGTDPAARMATDIQKYPLAFSLGPSTSTHSTLSGFPAVQVAGDMDSKVSPEWRRVTRAVVYEHVLFAANVAGRPEAMEAQAADVTAFLDSVRFHDLERIQAAGQ